MTAALEINAMSMICNRRIEDLREGDMIIYPFLWAWEVEKGITQASKSRPCMVAMRRERKDNSPVVIILPITTRPQAARDGYVALPQSELRRAGLNGLRPQGIMTRDCNIEDLGHPVGLAQMMRADSFSSTFTREVAQCFARDLERDCVRPISRIAILSHDNAPVIDS